MKKRSEPLWKQLLGVLQTGSDFDVLEAAKALARCRSGYCVDALVTLMHSHAAPFVSAMAAYSLLLRLDRRFIPAFIRCLHEFEQHEKVRGQAAEAIGSLLDHCHPKTAGWKAAESVLLGNLHDPSPTVRFWCSYSLGCLRSKRAIAPLEHLRLHDSTIVPGWWYVHEEASDALARIAGRPGNNDRVPMHLRHEERITS